MINTPHSGDDDGQPESDLDKVAANPQATDVTRSADKQEKVEQHHFYAQYVVRPLKTVGRGIIAVVNWTDENNGFVTALATVAIAILTGVYVHYSRAQWKVMRDQLPDLHTSAEAAKDAAKAADASAKTAQQQLEMSERPWMSAEFFINQPIEFQPNGDIGAQVHAIIKNIGHSVATDVRLILGADPEGKGLWFTEIPKAQKEMCEVWRNVKFPSDTGSFTTLFPGEAYTENESFVVTRKQIDKVQVQDRSSGKNVITGIALFGCVEYKFAFAPGYHQTGFSYELIKPSVPLRHPRKFNEPVGGSLFWKIGENIPASQLIIRRSLFGSFYVD